MKPTRVSGLETLISKYDLFLIDQYGVLHNGIEPYSGAVDALKMLRSKNKRVVVISNSGKRARVNIDRLVSLGFSENLFDDVVTSGEVAFRQLKPRMQSSSINSCYFITRGNDLSAIEGLDIGQAAEAASADVILIAGSEAEKYGEDQYRDQLRDAAIRQIPCICTNPDKKMLTQAGLQFGAGRIAEIYQELGGTVEWIGKPHPDIYWHILRLHSDAHTDRVLCIGDSTEHDIAGGQGVSLKTLLVMTGVNTGLGGDELQNQFRQYNATPDYIAPELVF